MKIKILSFIVVSLALIGSFTVTQKDVAWAQSPTDGTCTTTMPSNKATVSLSYTVASQASYNVWSRIQGTGSGWIQVDSQCPVLLGNVAEWTWVNYQRDDASKKILYPLTAGQHTVKYVVESGNFNVDRVILVDDVNCIPTGLGTNCDGSPSDPNNPGSPTYTCLGSCPTVTPTLTPTAAPAGSAPCTPAPSRSGGGGFLGFLLEFILRLLQALFGGSSGGIGCQPPTQPIATPAATVIPTTFATPTASATATPTPTDTPTPTASATPTLAITTTVAPSDGPCIQSVVDQQSRRDRDGDRQERRGFFRSIFDFFIRLLERIWRFRPGPQQPVPAPTNVPSPTDATVPTVIASPSAPIATLGPCPTGTTTLTPTVTLTNTPTVTPTLTPTLTPSVTP